MAQRLVRLNCVKCKQPYSPPEAELRSAGVSAAMAAKATFMRGRGCAHCNHTGYRGRIGIFEMMKLNASIREMTFAQAPTQTLRKAARESGMRTLLEDGCIKICKGSTTLEEVLSTCHAEIQELQSSNM